MTSNPGQEQEKGDSECVGEKANVGQLEGRKGLIIQSKIHKFNHTWKKHSSDSLKVTDSGSRRIRV